jgi:hypothetical protein
MKNRTITYFRKSKAMKIMESPLQADLQTLLSATFALTRNNVVKKHITSTLQELNSMMAYRLSA